MNFPDGEGTRARIMELIQERPGINKSRLCRELGIGWGTAGHHIRILREQGSLYGIRDGRSLTLFPPGVSPEEARLLSLLADDVCVAVVQSLQQEPGQGLSQISRRLGVSRKTVRRHLQALDEQGIVGMRGARHPRYEVPPDIDLPPAYQ